MGFLEHLDELRTRLIRSLISLAVGMAIAFAFVERISAFVLGPVKQALTPDAQLVAGLTESVAFNIDLAFIGGVILAAPFITYQVWRFVAPGLYANEKRLVVPLVLMATAGTVAGAAFSHYVLFPSTVEFLSRWWLPPGVRLLAGLTDTFGLYKSMLLAMVAVFQLPAVICLLARLGAVTAGFLWRNLQYAILVIFTVAALITSTVDPWNMLFTAAPMLVMYVFSIAVAWLATPRGKRAGVSGSSHAMGLLLGLSIAREVWRRQRREMRTV